MIFSYNLNAKIPSFIIDENYKQNHFKELHNYSVHKNQKVLPSLIHKNGNSLSTLYFEKYQTNQDKEKHLFVYQSGRYKGTKVLIELSGGDVAVNAWIPQLRKSRRLTTFKHDESWNGTNFTYADILLRRPFDEKHSIQGEDKLSVNTANLMSFQRVNYCPTEYKNVISIKSIPKKETTAYDYRIEYYKNEKLIKTIEKGWYAISKDIKIQAYIHATNHKNKTQSLIYIPQSSHTYNNKISKHFFSKLSLHKKKYIYESSLQEVRF